MKQSIKAFIIASVLLNLLMAGVIFGHIGRHYLWQRDRMSSQELAGVLPEDKFKLFEQVMQRTEEDTSNLHEQLEEARTRAADILKAEPFNRQAYLAQIKNMQDLRAQITQHMAQSIAGFAEELTPTERVALADTLRRSGPLLHSRKTCDAKPGEGDGKK